MRFTQTYLKQQLHTYIKDLRPTVIFTSEQQKCDVERLLLEVSSQKAFFHVVVTTPQHYCKELLAKNEIFKIHLMTQAEALMAVRQTLDIPSLNYFKNVTIDGQLLLSLLSTFEKMADIDLDLEVPFDQLSILKWQELKMMYQYFSQLKGDAMFEGEIFQLAQPYLDENVRYMDLTFQPYSNAWDSFLKAAKVLNKNIRPMTDDEKWLDENYHQTSIQANPRFPLDIYQVQFMHQEYQLIIEEISKALKKGVRYQDIAVYFPNNELLNGFVERCPYPCNYEIVATQERELAFLNAWFDYLYTKDVTSLDKAKKLSYFTEEDFSTWQNKWQIEGINYLDLLKEVVSDMMIASLTELPLDLNLQDYALIAPILLSSSAYVAKEGLDRIQLLTYRSPLLAKHFELVFLCGLNEDVYPTKVSDKGLLLNDELRFYYPFGTPLDRQNNEEWEMVKHILLSANHFVATCHFGSLDGSECLPSLLFNHLLSLKSLKRAPTYPLQIMQTSQDDLILEAFEKSVAQPQPLSSEFAKTLYAKQGKQQLSPSELENFNQCPYRHFISYGLKLYPEKTAMLTRQRFGTLMHDLLDECSDLFGLDFMERLAKKEQALGIQPTASLDERLHNIMVALLVQKKFVPNDLEEAYLYETFQVQFMNTLKVLLHHLGQGEFTLAYHEQAISATKDGVNYTGRIDRADVYQDYLKILDYKSSNKKLELGLAMQGFNIQMLVYLALMAEKYHLKKGAVLYFNTNNRKLAAKSRMNLDSTSAKDFLAEYKMEGYVLEEETHDVMHAIDCDYTNSQIANIRYVKSKDSYTGNLLQDEQWDNLINEIFKHLRTLVERCFEQGDIAVYPAGSKESAIEMKVSPCRFCDYQSLCLKDPFYHEKREILNYSKEDVDKILKGGGSDE